MRWEEITESETRWFPAAQLLQVYPELNRTQDLHKAVKWMRGVDFNSCEVTVGMESIAVFQPQIDEMMASWTAFPKDKARTKKIMREIKDGERALPVFVEYGDDNNFIIEGRHRIVAFHLLGMTKVIVVRLRDPEEQ